MFYYKITHDPFLNIWISNTRSKILLDFINGHFYKAVVINMYMSVNSDQ